MGKGDHGVRDGNAWTLAVSPTGELAVHLAVWLRGATAESAGCRVSAATDSTSSSAQSYQQPNISPLKHLWCRYLRSFRKLFAPC